MTSIKAVAYYRSAIESSDLIETQRIAIHAFAKKHGIEIIHEEFDNGETGHTLQRPGLTRLLDGWITNPGAPFTYVLIKNVARLGRFVDSTGFWPYKDACEKHGRTTIFLDSYELSTKETT